jgi:hypothetical protein
LIDPQAQIDAAKHGAGELFIRVDWQAVERSQHPVGE